MYLRTGTVLVTPILHVQCWLHRYCMYSAGYTDTACTMCNQAHYGYGYAYTQIHIILHRNVKIEIYNLCHSTSILYRVLKWLTSVHLMINQHFLYISIGMSAVSYSVRVIAFLYCPSKESMTIFIQNTHTVLPIHTQHMLAHREYTLRGL
jgi:uncharacterized protein YcgI (DUF1989 family)